MRLLPSQVAIPVRLGVLPDAHGGPVWQDELGCFFVELVLLDCALGARGLEVEHETKLGLVLALLLPGKVLVPPGQRVLPDLPAAPVLDEEGDGDVCLLKFGDLALVPAGFDLQHVLELLLVVGLWVGL